ncbi:zeta toxin [Acinetobacter ihumii]|uniref:zeta toxin n=1 Tax=Acinetobacter ihumii TaxID=2483802 RepID=UPI0013EF0F02|nr:zeta toxin [Acinetobacter ihumii]
MPQPRIRMFAGPNGSGKSTIKDYLLPRHIGAYLNADELEKQLIEHQCFSLTEFHESLENQQLIDFLKLKKRQVNHKIIPLLSSDPIILANGKIAFETSEIDSYLAARIIDFIRIQFLELNISFTFETVMSHISKVEFLAQAKAQGFRTYLYYVSTIDPDININRVQYRVSQGGHHVPENKIRTRYVRSMDLLMDAIDASDRAYIFDNSSDGTQASFLAEIENAEILRLNKNLQKFPKWFVDRVLNEFM